MVEHYSLTLTGSVQRLSSVLVTTDTANIPNVEKSYSFISLQAAGGNSGLIYVGGFPQIVSSTLYGFRIEVPVSTIPSAPSIIELSGGASIRLSEITVLGTNNDVLKIFLHT